LLEGGLGIRDFTIFNECISCQVVKEVYELEREAFENHDQGQAWARRVLIGFQPCKNGAYGVGHDQVWVGRLNWISPTLFSRWVMVPPCFFWNHKWCDGVVLKDRFCSLYALHG